METTLRRQNQPFAICSLSPSVPAAPTTCLRSSLLSPRGGNGFQKQLVPVFVSLFTPEGGLYDSLEGARKAD